MAIKTPPGKSTSSKSKKEAAASKAKKDDVRQIRVEHVFLSALDDDALDEFVSELTTDMKDTLNADDGEGLIITIATPMNSVNEEETERIQNRLLENMSASS